MSRAPCGIAVEREAMPLAMSGFGQEVREAMDARAAHLAAQGLQRCRLLDQRLRVVRRQHLLGQPLGLHEAGVQALAADRAVATELILPGPALVLEVLAQPIEGGGMGALEVLARCCRSFGIRTIGIAAPRVGPWCPYEVLENLDLLASNVFAVLDATVGLRAGWPARMQPETAG